jgi:hypothetical protein
MKGICMIGFSKLDELRFKTGKQVVQLIHNELDLGIRTARHALNSADIRTACAQGYYCVAKSAYAQAARLIPLVGDFREDERGGMKTKLDRLQEMLDRLAAIGSKPTPTESEIAALARVLWEARGCPEGWPEEDWFRAERALKPRMESHAACVGLA